ncbi:receptor-type tyrosine-protein phosphatase H-like isoform X3 [Pristis pectinata]|uniref:receptor-type tyrosine-protein phosphatase H-like isoform X3 n=1 Tax=Pristis pectinata TaxID=685728 RepID=UPI00223DE191|nr:receptor-type tyrosine-protein phosphatase H-like isoform X3 [Pristis pectinata]
MRWSWMERGMSLFNCWLVLVLSLISTWEIVCSQICPDNIQVSPVNTTALKVAWNYTFEDFKWINITLEKTTTKYNSNIRNHEVIIGDLVPGMNYNILIHVEITNESSMCNQSGTTNPSPVIGLSAVNRTTDSLGLIWTAPDDTRASNYEYKITVTGADGHIRTNYTSPDETTFTVRDLDPGNQYNLSVQSVTPEQTLSTPQEVTNTTNPSPVIGLSAVNRTTNSLGLIWTAPDDTRASNYEYKITVTGADGHSRINYTSPDETAFTAMDLDPGNQYNLSVQSVTPEQTLSTPQEVTNTTNPSPVIGLSAVNRTTNSLGLIWTAPDNTRASNYEYKITVTGADGHSRINYISPDETAFTAMDLDPGNQYNLSVQSVTPEQTLSTPQEVTNTTNPSPVIGLSAVNRTTNSLGLIWTVPDDTRASNYEYKITVTGADGHSRINYTSPDETAFTVRDLDPGNQYNLSVESVTPEQTLSTPQEVTNTTNPSPVIGLSAVNRTTNSLGLIWTVPDDTRASNYEYKITVTGAGGHSRINYTGPDETAFTAMDLDPGNQYNLLVQSVTPEQTLSTPQEVTDTTNPSSVTDLSVVNRTTDSFEIRWTAPNDTRAPDYMYKIGVTNVTGGDSRSECTSPGETAFTVKELVPGTQYKLMVQSDTPERTLSTPVYVIDTTFPDAISNLHCAGSTGYMIRAKWSKPKGEFTRFRAVTYDGEELVANRTVEKEKSGLMVFGLQPGRKYTIKIFTVNGQTSSKQETKQCWTSSQPIIIGATVGSLLGLILIGILLFFIIHKGRHQRKQHDPGFSSMTSLSSACKPIPLTEYNSYFQQKHADTDIGFAEEYQSLAKVGIDQPKEVSQFTENKVKNRYINIFPYDAARVKLSCQPDSSSSDYINASYMPGYNLDKAFIAAQGPLPNTVADFWRMIWEQKSKVIVMLTNCVELSRVKCEHYWPMDFATYGDITVNILSEDILPEWTIRNFSIKKAGYLEPRLITQFHFTSWPDHGVPKTTEKLLQFQKLIRDHLNKNQGGLPVVHCSAGVGRTGTLIALDYLMQQIEKEAVVDVYGIVYKMRMNRTCMVQTECQYIFLHQCILDMIQNKCVSEPIYQNQMDLIYQNVSAIKAANNHHN